MFAEDTHAHESSVVSTAFDKLGCGSAGRSMLVTWSDNIYNHVILCYIRSAMLADYIGNYTIGLHKVIDSATCA